MNFDLVVSQGGPLEMVTTVTRIRTYEDYIFLLYITGPVSVSKPQTTAQRDTQKNIKVQKPIK